MNPTPTDPNLEHDSDAAYDARIAYSIRKHQAGYSLAQGAWLFVWGLIKAAVVIAAVICFAIVMWRNTFNIGTDSTDYSGWKRSGLTLHTDALTGLQYLSDGHGGLTPRMGPNGGQMRKTP